MGKRKCPDESIPGPLPDGAKGAIEGGEIIARFFVPGRPVPWKTHRGSGRRSYRDPKVAVWQQVIGLFARVAMEGREPYDGPISFSACFDLRSGRRRLPDRTNLLKAAEDACQGIVFVNDRQVVGGIVMRREVVHAEGVWIEVVEKGGVR